MLGQAGQSEKSGFLENAARMGAGYLNDIRDGMRFRAWLHYRIYSHTIVVSLLFLLYGTQRGH
jgi:hypothetical protein